MTQKFARCSLGLSSGGNQYSCVYEWPESCFAQCGEGGLVLSKKESYRTAFFEAFPRDPDTYIRGEGKSVQLAEKSAWDKWVKIRDCKDHEFERRNYTNGLGFCKHCGMSKSEAFDPLTRCHICDTPTSWGTLKDDNYYCEKHYNEQPVEMARTGLFLDVEEEDIKPGMTVGEARQAHLDRLDAELAAFDPEKFKESLESLHDALISNDDDSGKSQD